VFLNTPIRGEYTPLDIRAINDWFAAHPDAILVTDKLNKPARMAAEFIDPSRLWMELFSLGALKEAESVGFKGALASTSVLSDHGYQSGFLAIIKDLGLKGIAVGRNEYFSQSEFFKEVERESVPVLVFNIYLEDEKISPFATICELGKGVTGMYVDDLPAKVLSETVDKNICNTDWH
jgi:hypothetical protein